MPEKLVIDGSYGEGGGQILRTALALAAVTGRAIKLRRSAPGARAQVWQRNISPAYVRRLLCAMPG
jgi:RNA 3'-terminal phosphate cyclase